MLNIFKEINALPGVRGVLANIQDIGIVSAGLDDDLSSLALNQFEIFLAKQGKLSGQDIEIRFDEAVILTRRIDDNNTLAILGSPDINLGLLNVTLDMLQEGLKTAAVRMSHPTQQEENSIDTEDTPPAVESVDFKLSGPLQNRVMAIQQALLETIGPLARTILSDSVKSWAQVGPASTRRLTELIDLLCMEIGDVGLENKFRQAADSAATGSDDANPVPHNHPPKPDKPKKILVNKQMAQKFAEIMTRYTSIMGPVGSLIMKDYLQEWAASGEATEARIPELMKMLGKEIADQGDREEFLR
jgi:hypothetical protein